MLRIAFALSLLSAAACGTGSGSGGDDDSPDAGELSASCLEAESHSDAEWIQQNVFTPSCAAFNACHKGAALSAGGLNLEAGQAEANLVGSGSSLFPEFELIEPGSPTDSYLLVILGAQDGPLDPEVGMMPFNSPPLCEPKLGAIRRWIESM